jgi:hypothetical protein
MIERYIPIEMPIKFQINRSNLLKLNYDLQELVADFRIPSDETRLVRVSFEKIETFRVVDEALLSDEHGSVPYEGILDDHMAYEVENGYFKKVQSSLIDLSPTAHKQYQFITGWMCLDVISSVAPTILITPYCHSPA